MRRLPLLLIIALTLSAAAFGQQTEESLLKRAFVKALSNDLVGAIADYTAVIKLNPNSDKAYNLRGNHREQNGDVAGSIEDYTSAITLVPKMAVYFGNRANAYSRLGDSKRALADYDSALKLDPTSKLNDTLYLARGRLKFGLKDYEGAIADLGKAIEFNPNFVAAFEARSKVYRALGKIALADADDKNAETAKQKLLEIMNKHN